MTGAFVENAPVRIEYLGPVQQTLSFVTRALVHGQLSVVDSICTRELKAGGVMPDATPRRHGANQTSAKHMQKEKAKKNRNG